MTPVPDSTIALRVAHEDERDVIRRIAELDDARGLEGPVLLAIIDGDAAAAISLRDGRVIANPFVPTAEAVALLRLRASHLSETGMHPRFARTLRPRVA